jgi:predicted SAM-dependent methyltransferase
MDEQGELKLEIGAGSNPQPGFVHHDVRELPDIDVICDARSFPAEHKGIYSEVYASNILEHFNRFEVEKVFAEWVSLLKPGGTMKIIVPDIQEIMPSVCRGSDTAQAFRLSVLRRK